MPIIMMCFYFALTLIILFHIRQQWIMERVTTMENKTLTCGEQFRQGKTPSKEITIEGTGTVFLYGTWNAEKMINKLLDCDEITG